MPMLTMQATTSRMTQQVSSTFRQTAIFAVPAAAAKNSSARKISKRPAIPSGCMNKIFFHISHLSLRTFANNQKVPIPQRHVIRRMWGGHFLFCDFIGARYFHRSGIKFSCRRCPRLGNHYLMNRLSRSSPLPWAHIRQGKQDCLRGLLIATCFLGRHHRH